MDHIISKNYHFTRLHAESMLEFLSNVCGKASDFHYFEITRRMSKNH